MPNLHTTAVQCYQNPDSCLFHKDTFHAKIILAAAAAAAGQ